MDTAAVLAAADRLFAARIERKPVEMLPEYCKPQDETEAYVIQSTVHTRLTEAGMGTLAGYKLGCTNPGAQQMFGSPTPVYGAVFSPNVFEGRTEFGLGDFEKAGAECEIVVRFGADVPADGAPYDRESIGEYVDAVMTGLEVVNNRYGDMPGMGAPMLVADDFAQFAVVLGWPYTDWRSLDLAALTGRMTIDGTEVGTGTGAAAVGHPLNAAAWLANALITRGQPPKAGQFVFTGAVLPPQWIDMGPTEVIVGFETLGEVTAVYR